MLQDMKADSKEYEMSIRNGRSGDMHDGGASIRYPTPPADDSEALYDSYGQAVDDDISMGEDDSGDAGVAS
jgi:hypothetical protein